MTDRFKFRAWDKLSGRMMYGTPWQVMTTCAENPDFVVMQWTGLKDDNGADIYEGDILLIGDDDLDQLYDEAADEYRDVVHAEVIWCGDSYPAFDLRPSPYEDVNGLSQAKATGRVRVIGNRWNTPELLPKADPEPAV
jgi:uncharacterized phage protein (TIGR01671 family)